jgi:DNA-binding MarR family transcriptional regulator
MSSEDGLTQLEMFILRSIQRTPKLETLAKEAKVSPVTLGMEIAKLQLRGYIQENGTLSQKGQRAITSKTPEPSH